MERTKFQPVRVFFSLQEYMLLKQLSEEVHVSKDSMMIKRMIQEIRENFEENNKFGVYVPFRNMKREKVVMVYPDVELYKWLSIYASKLDVVVPWVIRLLICPELEKYEKKLEEIDGGKKDDMVHSVTNILQRDQSMCTGIRTNPGGI